MGELEAIVQNMFAAIDRKDADGIIGDVAEGAQAIDEISRRWIRGREEIADYIRGLVGAVEDVSSELREVHETVLGDAGILTCWVEQDYTLEGQRQHISAPTTVVLRRSDGGWKVALFHSIPLPEHEA